MPAASESCWSSPSNVVRLRVVVLSLVLLGTLRRVSNLSGLDVSMRLYRARLLAAYFNQREDAKIAPPRSDGRCDPLSTAESGCQVCRCQQPASGHVAVALVFLCFDL